MVTMLFAGYCEKISAPCEHCGWDGKCNAVKCTEGYLSEAEDEEREEDDEVYDE